MSEYLYDQNKLPPGWDCKYDPATGLYFYINYFTKKTTFDDPRKLKEHQAPSITTSINSSDNIAMQPLHGSPYHVYPTNNYPTMQAFQGPAIGVHSVSASPLLNSKLQQMEISSNMTRPSTPRTNIHVSRSSIHETSLSNIPVIDTEASVQKINTMFPTVTETHIRLLLKKYYNREAVVISALQVEKHPITTPGPYTPPLTARHMHHPAIDGSGIFQLSNLRNGSPRPTSCASTSYYGSPKIDGFRHSPKPHSSPKMKLRYLKSIYPKAEETLILDVLSNSDNNVQKASEQLSACGYEKKDTTVPKMSMRKKDEARNEIKNQIDRAAQETYTPPPKAKTLEEKSDMKTKLQQTYENIPERIILMALESVDYSEDKAIQILNIVVEDDNKKINEKKNEDSDVSGSTVNETNTSITMPSNKSVFKTPTGSTATTPTATFTSVQNTVVARRHPNRLKIQQKHSPGCDTSMDLVDNTVESEMNASRMTCAVGPNKGLIKGPNDEILLVDYVVWNGANPTLATGPVNKVNDLTGRKYVPKGSNSELCKGPTPGLAKGSIYSKVNHSVICT